MKKLLIAILLTAVTALAGTRSISLAWDPNPEGQAAGFKLYWGMASGNYSSSTNVGTNTTWTLSGLPYGTNYFAATSYDTNGVESDFSNEVSQYFKRPGPTLRIVGQLQASSNDPVGPWGPVPGSLPVEMVLQSSDVAQFFRVQMQIEQLE